MKDKGIIAGLIENNQEHVEAVPGPAIVISQETYKKMQQNNQAKQNQERLKQYKPFFEKIKQKNFKTKNNILYWQVLNI